MRLQNFVEWKNDDSTLFTDCVGSAELYITESKDSNRIKFRGKFQEANAINKNKRMYPYDVLNKNVDRLMETVKNRGLIGELDHPTDSIIHFDKASHLITRLWWDNNTLMGEGEILPTPHGKILQNLIESNVQIGISSRGVGNGQVNNEGVLVIGESYKLITFDAVADPSTFAAYQKVITGDKTESMVSRQVINNTNSKEDRHNDVKNETHGLNMDNENVLVAYLGQVIKNRINKAKGFK